MLLLGGCEPKTIMKLKMKILETSLECKFVILFFSLQANTFCTDHSCSRWVNYNKQSPESGKNVKTKQTSLLDDNQIIDAGIKASSQITTVNILSLRRIEQQAA